MLKTISLKMEEISDDKLFGMVKAAGFKGVDLGLHGDWMHEPDCKQKVEKVRKLLDDNNMVCSQVHLPFYNIFCSSELYDDVVENDMKNAFEMMSILGTKWGAYHPMSSTNYEYDRKRALRDNKEKLERYLETASKFNVGIAVENLPIFPDCPQYKFFTYDEEDHIALVDSIKSDLIGICWDFGHSNMMKYDMATALDKIGNRLKITHMHNNNEMCDWHVCPGIGTIKWEKVLPVLKKHGYSGPATFEGNLNLIHPVIMEDYLKMSSKMLDYMIDML